jgi:SAM-dependent methyltransferase
MSEMKPEFDALSVAYEELLRDPIRDKFTAGTADYFHLRKRDLIREYLRRRGSDSRRLKWLDIGCGQGTLLTMLRDDFAAVAGCDPSAGMLRTGGLGAAGIEMRVQRDGENIPFDSAQFDFITAVCVYHHVPIAQRDKLTAEVRRVLKPGGLFCIVEHNPWNPATRLVVSRTPVDADAILLRSAETRRLLRRGGFQIDGQRYFLFFPEGIYAKAGWLESALRHVPMGGQYAVFGKSPATRSPALP